MQRTIISLIAVIVGFTFIPFAAEAAEPSYSGKTMHIIVGYPPGGAFDQCSRMISRHMGKYLPGNPTVIVDNMPGAAGLMAAKYIHRAKPDGLTVGNVAIGLVMGKVLGREEIDLDIRKFEWVGVPARETMVFVLTKASGIRTVNQWMASKAPVKIGAITGDLTRDGPRILKAVLGLPMQIVEGYKGTADIRLAAESGEVAGGFWMWESMITTWSKGIASGDVVVVLQVASKPHPDLPNIPLAGSLATTEEGRLLIKAGIQDPATTMRLYFLPPGTPKEVVQTIRKAFQDTLKDPEFLAEAKKSSFYVNPVAGAEVEEIINGLFNLSPGTLAKLKEILAPDK